MRTIKLLLILVFSLTFFQVTAGDEIEYPAYYKITTVTASIDEVAVSVKDALAAGEFIVIGEYSPGNNPDLYVICYTRKDLADITLKFEDRGALASVMKIGLKKNGDIVDVSMINPEYIFYAYLYEDIDPYLKDLLKISEDAKTAMSALGNDFTPFGGFQERDDLDNYRYKIMMPYFTDPVEFDEFDSFETGLNIIRTNLIAQKGNTVMVYEVVYPEQKVAIFGVGLLDPEEGEADFLPVIGDDHVAAMPYEIIVQDKVATILHGRYRIALHWPELSMGTFMKIMSTPGNIEDFMEAICTE
jgi:hypothetical protein